MRIVSHGEWERYQPVKEAPGTPPNILYARRKKDGVDWYAYVNSKKFQDRTVKITLFPEMDKMVVGAATYDGTALFPGGQTVLEVYDFTGNDPQSYFGGKVFDAATREFTARTFE